MFNRFVLKHFFSMDDVYLEMKWEITTIIPLVSRFCPSDTMRLWKRGSNIRADFHLIGMEKLSWQRGDRSIMFTFNTDPKKAAGNTEQRDLEN